MNYSTPWKEMHGVAICSSWDKFPCSAARPPHRQPPPQDGEAPSYTPLDSPCTAGEKWRLESGRPRAPLTAGSGAASSGVLLPPASLRGLLRTPTWEFKLFITMDIHFKDLSQ